MKNVALVVGFMAVGLSVVIFFARMGAESETPALVIYSGTKNAPLGESCSKPLSWDQAEHHEGENMSVRGPVKSVSFTDHSDGQSVFINIGSTFPQTPRLTAVIDPQSVPLFDEMLDDDIRGQYFCITGSIEYRQGVSLIEITERKQIFQKFIDRYPTDYAGDYREAW